LKWNPIYNNNYNIYTVIYGILYRPYTVQRTGKIIFLDKNYCECSVPYRRHVRLYRTRSHRYGIKWINVVYLIHTDTIIEFSTCRINNVYDIGTTFHICNERKNYTLISQVLLKSFMYNIILYLSCKAVCWHRYITLTDEKEIYTGTVRHCQRTYGTIVLIIFKLCSTNCIASINWIKQIRLV
jgi:hypothetical protein